MRVVWFVAIAIILIASGCTSVSGHKVVRAPDGSIADVVDVKGITIAVQTPTTAMFLLTKSRYHATAMPPDAAGNVSCRYLGKVIEITLSETPILLGPSEIHTIDPKRPAAASIDYDMDFEDQYPKKIKGIVEDRTTEQLRTLVKDLVAEANGERAARHPRGRSRHDDGKA